MCHHASPYGIQFNIAIHRQQVSFSIHQGRFIAALPQRTGASIGVIEILNILATLRLHHTANPMLIAGRNQKMNMISHQYEGVNGDAIFFCSVLEKGQIGLVISLIKKVGFSVITSLNNMMGTAG
ncbi:MAG: hypothetical protein ACI8RU_000058 [Zhongshania aliphaticivorans]|jgi:hypothetical protein